MLTPRQISILDLLSRGLIYKEVAKQLGLSVKTVESHCTSIREALKMHSAAGAVGEAFRLGILRVESEATDAAIPPPSEG